MICTSNIFVCIYLQETFDKLEKEEQRNRRARGEWTHSSSNDASKHAPIYVKVTASEKSHRVRNAKFNKVKNMWCAKLKISKDLPGWLKEAKENPSTSMFLTESSQTSSRKRNKSSSSKMNGSSVKQRSPAKKTR